MSMNVQGTKRKRSCIGCGLQDDKVRLHRIVRSPEGVVSFDATGRLSGRGAYVCSPACFEAASKKRKFDRALKTSLSAEDYNRISEFLTRHFAELENADEE